MREKAKILIVDDDDAVRLAYAAILARADCETQTAWDGVEALRAMEQRPSDVVLLDLRMPGPDGLTVLKQLKQRWPDSEVVIITGYPTVESAKEAVRLGAYEYLPKPVGPDTVIDAARGALTRKQWALRDNVSL
ncbi:MAG TPA: response regulator [Burkholderiales bacterium]